MKVGIIGGTVFYKSPLFAKTKPKSITNCYGETDVFSSKKAMFIPRHRINHNIPPHKINHLANMMAFKEAGVEYVIGVCSAGSLQSSLKPGSIVIPDDYINLWGHTTIFSDSVVHITPELNEELRNILSDSAKSIGHKIVEGGIYFQSTGPRLETKAEIKMMSNFADIVGMTMGQEATVAQEIGLKYAALCSVDNYANGIKYKEISSEDIFEFAVKNSETVKEIALKSVEKINKN